MAARSIVLQRENSMPAKGTSNPWMGGEEWWLRFLGLLPPPPAPAKAGLCFHLFPNFVRLGLSSGSHRETPECHEWASVLAGDGNRGGKQAVAPGGSRGRSGERKGKVTPLPCRMRVSFPRPQECHGRTPQSERSLIPTWPSWGCPRIFQRPACGQSLRLAQLPLRRCFFLLLSLGGGSSQGLPSGRYERGRFLFRVFPHCINYLHQPNESRNQRYGGQTFWAEVHMIWQGEGDCWHNETADRIICFLGCVEEDGPCNFKHVGLGTSHVQETSEGQSVGCHNACRTGFSHVHTVSRDGQQWKWGHCQLQTWTSEFVYLDKYTYF